MPRLRGALLMLPVMCPGAAAPEQPASYLRSRHAALSSFARLGLTSGASLALEAAKRYLISAPTQERLGSWMPLSN